MIRQAKLEDASRLAEILIFAKRATYRNIFNDDKISFGEMQVLPLALEFINNANSLEDIIVLDEEFVKGMARTSVFENAQGEKCVEVNELYVDPFFQKQGVGGKLMSKILKDSKTNGATNVFLWVLEKNKPARFFYEASGFTPTEDRKLVEKTPEYVLKYNKKL